MIPGEFHIFSGLHNLLVHNDCSIPLHQIQNRTDSFSICSLSVGTWHKIRTK